ncbi:MAG TPA: hypothetical protein VF294_12245, partial [Polyangiaceae bacterium]
MSDYSIDVPHFYSLRYSDSARSMSLELDMRDSTPCIYVRAISAWDPPHEAEAVTETKRGEIVQRVYDFSRDVKGYDAVEIDRATWLNRKRWVAPR